MKFVIIPFLGACHAFGGTGCFAAIHAKGVGFPRRPLAQRKL
jgi:hypothetical protein